MKWYKSEATHEVQTVDCDNSPTTVFLRRNIVKEQRETKEGEVYFVWVYEEAKITHDQYEQMLTEEIARITPYTASKNAYIDDTSVTFTDVPDGTMSISVKDSDGNYPDYTTERTSDKVVFHFSEPLSKVTTVTISVL